MNLRQNTTFSVNLFSQALIILHQTGQWGWWNFACLQNYIVNVVLALELQAIKSLTYCLLSLLYVIDIAKSPMWLLIVHKSQMLWKSVPRMLTQCFADHTSGQSYKLSFFTFASVFSTYVLSCLVILRHLLQFCVLVFIYFILQHIMVADAYPLYFHPSIQTGVFSTIAGIIWHFSGNWKRTGTKQLDFENCTQQ